MARRPDARGRPDRSRLAPARVPRSPLLLLHGDVAGRIDLPRLLLHLSQREGGLRRQGLLVGPHQRRGRWPRRTARPGLPRLAARALALQARRLSRPRYPLGRLARRGLRCLARPAIDTLPAGPYNCRQSAFESAASWPRMTASNAGLPPSSPLTWSATAGSWSRTKPGR